MGDKEEVNISEPITVRLTSREEVAALPEGSLLMDSAGCRWQRLGDNAGYDAIPLPVVVLRVGFTWPWEGS